MSDENQTEGTETAASEPAPPGGRTMTDEERQEGVAGERRIVEILAAAIGANLTTGMVQWERPAEGADPAATQRVRINQTAVAADLLLAAATFVVATGRDPRWVMGVLLHGMNEFNRAACGETIGSALALVREGELEIARRQAPPAADTAPEVEPTNAPGGEA